MKTDYGIAKRLALGLALVVALGLAASTAAKAANPLSSDDITLLLLGGSPSQKIIALVEQRGVSFQMSPDLAKKFHDQGATDDLIDALTKASLKGRPSTAPAQPSATNQSAPESSAPTPPQPLPSAPAAAPAQQASTQAASEQSAEQKIQETMQDLAKSKPLDESEQTPTTSRPAAKKAAANVPLKDPSPAEIQHIIQEFAAKEKIFKQARDNYTYHQINKVDELGPDNEVVGQYIQEWDILYDDNGQRIERVTYAPVSTLKRLMVTKEDLDAMRNIQPFVLTTDELPEYDIKYLGHVRVDEITAYVFSIRPKEIKKGRLYFQGVVWVDDQDLQIVKTEGKSVPETRTSKGENLFPRFTTWRQQIDGKFWFPTFTLADDTLYFPTGPVHIKEVIRYSDYKQFKAGSRILTVETMDNKKVPPAGQSPDQKK